MGLFPLKGKTGMVPQVRRTLWAMQELGRLATESGLDTLRKLTQEPVGTDPARVSLVARDRVGRQLAHHEGAEVGARFVFTGETPGLVATLFDRDHALRLVDLLLGNTKGTTKRLGELETSAVAEMTNITLNSALNAVAAETGLRFHTEVPEVWTKVSDVDGFFNVETDAADHMLVVETPFHEPSSGLSGTMVLLFGIHGGPQA